MIRHPNITLRPTQPIPDIRQSVTNADVYVPILTDEHSSSHVKRRRCRQLRQTRQFFHATAAVIVTLFRRRIINHGDRLAHFDGLAG